MAFPRFDALFQATAFTEGEFDPQRLFRRVAWLIGGCVVFGIFWAIATEFFGLKTAASPLGMESLTTVGPGQAASVIRKTWEGQSLDGSILGATLMLFL